MYSQGVHDRGVPVFIWTEIKTSGNGRGIDFEIVKDREMARGLIRSRNGLREMILKIERKSNRPFDFTGPHQIK